jgi:hypothetical protein
MQSAENAFLKICVQLEDTFKIYFDMVMVYKV